MIFRKGSKNVALRRDFAHFVVHDPLSINLLNFLQNTEIPDEHFYSTLATVEWSQIKVRKLHLRLKSNCEVTQPLGATFIWHVGTCRFIFSDTWFGLTWIFYPPLCDQFCFC